MATRLPLGEAGDLATTLITVIEGSYVLCRAAGSLGPNEQAARTIAGVVRTRCGETR